MIPLTAPNLFVEVEPPSFTRFGWLLRSGKTKQAGMYLNIEPCGLKSTVAALTTID